MPLEGAGPPRASRDADLKSNKLPLAAALRRLQGGEGAGSTHARVGRAVQCSERQPAARAGEWRVVMQPTAPGRASQHGMAPARAHAHAMLPRMRMRPLVVKLGGARSMALRCSAARPSAAREIEDGRHAARTQPNGCRPCICNGQGQSQQMTSIVSAGRLVPPSMSHSRTCCWLSPGRPSSTPAAAAWRRGRCHRPAREAWPPSCSASKSRCHRRRQSRWRGQGQSR